MLRKISISVEAEEEFAAGYESYYSKDPEVGERFLSAVRRSLQAAVANPEIYPLRFMAIRRISVRKFPYGVFFSYDAATLYGHSIFHESKDPQRLDRLK